MWLNSKIIFYSLMAWLFIFFLPAACLRIFAAETSGDKTKNSATQQVGGLLFEVDEGVKVEQGPGGSVYVKSNREYMQEKFREIERRLGSLEEKVSKLETGASGGSPNPAPSGQEDAERRVYVT